MTYVWKCKRTYYVVAVAMNVNIPTRPPHPIPSQPPPPPTRAHTQNIHTRMASYWCWHQKLELIALITIVNGLWNLITGRPLQSGGTWKTTGFFGVSVSDSYRFLNNLANSRSTLFGLYGLPKRYLKKTFPGWYKLYLLKIPRFPTISNMSVYFESHS